MHCDFLHVTIPESHAAVVLRGVLDAMGSLGAVSVSPDLHRLGGGTVKFSEGRGFSMVGISGQVLDHLRLNGELSRSLHLFGSSPHRVTRVDVAHDVACSAPPVLRRLLRSARSGSISLTRKSLRSQSIRFIDNHNHYAPGDRTGTLYLGSRTAKVYARVYDKRNERLDRGFDDPGNLLRYELTVTGKLSPTLRDVVEPAPMFWKFMSDVLPPPANVSDWVGGADGFDISAPVALLPAEVMRRKLEASPDVAHLLDLADRIGPHGFDLLVRMLKRQSSSRPIQPLSSETGT